MDEGITFFHQLKANGTNISKKYSDYCKEYMGLAASANNQIRMSKASDLYENALNERMNRTIKEDFRPDHV